MSSLTGLDQKNRIALAFMKQASSDTFRICAKTAEELAKQIEGGTMPVDAAAALRLLVHIFETSAERD